MHKFRLWAPNAKSLEIEVSGARHKMACGAGGWWTAEVFEAAPGTDYGFVLNGGGGPLPDPRSPYQPNGPHAASRLVDHGSYKWNDRGFQARPLAGAIIYELHIGAFTPEGTFRSAIEKLDHLVELGITHIEFMPIAEFSGEWGWGYDGVALYAPHHHYGSPEDLKALIEACHAKGLAVLLDVVYNHLGPTGNYLSQFGPYFTNAYVTPWGAAVNLDHIGSHEARRFFLDNALMWLRDYHADGLRLDAIHAFQDDSAIHFLEQLSFEVENLGAHLGRHLVLIAESDLNDPRVVRSRDAHGFGMDAQWSDDLHHALHSVLTGETQGYYEDFGKLEHLATALKEAFVYSGDFSEHRQRLHGRSAMGLSGHRFLAYSQNHDQVGNRATGQRLSQLISPDLQKVAAALVLLSPFVPMLFMGEEYSASTPFLYFTQHEDQKLGNAVSQGRKHEFAAFGWNPESVPDPQSKETFYASKLQWEEVHSGLHQDIYDWYKQLIALRKSIPMFTNGRLDQVETCFSEKDRWFALTRGPVQVICNFAPEKQSVPVSGNLRTLLASKQGVTIANDTAGLPGQSVAILVQTSHTS